MFLDSVFFRRILQLNMLVTLDSNFFMTWVVGVNFFRGVFGLCFFQANLPLNMLVTLDSNFFHENLWKKLSPPLNMLVYFWEGMKLLSFPPE